MPQDGSQPLGEVKSQKSKVLWDGVFRDFKWLLYLRRGVLVYPCLRILQLQHDLLDNNMLFQ